jgi:hypothetical protein
MRASSAVAGIAAGLVVFAIGFVLGTLRMLVVVPWIGIWQATAVEIPIMLIASWFVVGWALRRYGVESPLDRLVMAAFAFGMLIAAELSLETLGFGGNFSTFMGKMFEGPSLLGLLAQIAFAMMPLVYPKKHNG